MIDVFFKSLESLLNWRGWYSEDPSDYNRRQLDKSKAAMRRVVRELHGTDYTAALDLLSEAGLCYMEYC